MNSTPRKNEIESVQIDPAIELLDSQCIFCLRVMKAGTTRHHLIPRRCHKNRWFQKRFTREQMQRTVPTCSDCHKAIHCFVPSEKTLGKDHNTVESLLAHDDFGRFVDWIKRQK